MKIKYKLGMAIILIMIFSLVIVYFDYQKFQDNFKEKEAMINVKSGLSINYLNGSKISTTLEEYTLDFSITNTTLDDLYYYVKLKDISGSDDVTYRLINKETNETKSDSLTKANILSRVKVLPSETKSYSLVISNPSKKLLEGEMIIDLESINNNLKNVIIKNNSVISDVTSSGLIETTIDDGNIYYFRGNVINNYVFFAGYTWRIVKINPDDTVLLVLDTVLDDSIPFYINNEYLSTSFLGSNIYSALSSWYEENLNEFDDYISNAKYCTDDNAQAEDSGTIHYLGEDRIFNNLKPVHTCPGTSYTSKIGLLTADDVMNAGGSLEANNNYYLYQNDITDAWWTMTPNKKENSSFYYIVTNGDGSLSKDHLESDNNKVRPAITLIKKLNATGSGNIDDPYVVSLQ